MFRSSDNNFEHTWLTATAAGTDHLIQEDRYFVIRAFKDNACV